MVTRTLTIVVVCGVLAGLAGCGSSGSTSSTTQTQSKSTAAAQSKSPAATSGKAKARSSGGASSTATRTTATAPTTTAARTTGASSESSTLTRSYGSVATFGHQAGPGDRSSVLAAFHAYLSAIAAGDWSAACQDLSTTVKSQLQALLARAGGGAGRCAPALGALLGRTPSAARRTLAQAQVIAVRTNGDRAFVLYRSPTLSHATISMFREAGRWTAGVLSANLSG